MLGVLLALLTMSTANAGTIKKWVDENGQVHYGDTVPASQADLERRVLSEQGVTVETIKRAKTEEEQAAERRQVELRAAIEKKQAEQAAKDHVLLATFSSEDDMVLTRDGKIAAIDTIIRLSKDRIRRITQQLRDWAHEAADFERSGKQVPDELQKQIANGKAEIQHLEQYIVTQQEEQENIRQKFAKDIERFRKLQNRSLNEAGEQVGTVQETPANAPAQP
jgi:uncharacterized coiled-coil protein SlyX